MNRTLKVTRLHLNKPATFWGVPLWILLAIMVVSIVIALAIQRVGGMDVDSAEYISGARSSQGLMWALPGFLIYYGVQGVATTYPLGLALGTTRRDFVLGTVIANALQALYLAVALTALLGLELLTDHWFAGVYVTDVYIAGAGNPLILFATVFLAALFCLTAGGVFAAIWVRFGAKGPLIMGLGLALAIAVALLLLAPHLAAIVGGMTRAWLALIAVIVIAVGLVVTWLAMRRASVR